MASTGTLTLLAEGWLESDLLDLHSKVVVSPLDEEVTVHSPLFTIGVSHDPVPSVSLGVLTPSNDHDGVVHIHPRDALVVKSGVTIFRVNLLLVAGLRLLEISLKVGFIIGGLNSFFKVKKLLGKLFTLGLVDVYKSLLAENALLVDTEHRWGLEITIYWTISQDFLHHFLL